MKTLSLNLKKALALVLSIAMVLTFIPFFSIQSNAEEEAPLTIAAAQMPAEYEALIEEICQTMDNGWDSTDNYDYEEVEAADLSDAAKEFFNNQIIDAGEPEFELYYALMDMNNDGTQELLIKSRDGEGDDDSLDLLCTIEGGKVVVIETYAYRNQARVVGKMIYNYGSSSAEESGIYILSLGTDNALKQEAGFVIISKSLEDETIDVTITEVDENGNVKGEISEDELDYILDDYLAADSPEWIDASIEIDPVVDPDPEDEPEIDLDTVTLPYKDVINTDWFINDVKYAYAYKLMNGVSEVKFDPNETITRAMIVTILYRIAGEPAFMNDNVFDDVAEGTYYEKAVVWASGKGIVNGTSATTFSPNTPVTREQFAAILYRYAQYIHIDVSDAKDTNMLSYDDFQDRSDYAADALQWVFTEGIMNGVTESTIVPQGQATRAQAAAIFHRFCEGDYPMDETEE